MFRRHVLVGRRLQLIWGVVEAGGLEVGQGGEGIEAGFVRDIVQAL